MDGDIFHFSASQEIEMVVRIAIAAAIGAVIGFERRRSRNAAGVRTLALVSMGAAVFTLVSVHGFEGFGTVRDPARIAAQVVTGIGFIGAGVMIRSGGMVRGLATAGGVWTAAALGMATGAGMYILAGAGGLLTLAVLYFLPRRDDIDGDAG